MKRDAFGIPSIVASDTIPPLEPPMMIPPPMLLTPSRSDLKMHISKDGRIFSFVSELTGSVTSFDTTTHKLAGATPARFDVPIFLPASFELGLARWHGPESPLMSGDIHDFDKSSHTTGGGRRSFVSVPFNHMARGLPDGRAALLSWARDQGQRPVAWWPWVFSYDAYYGVLGTDRKAPLWQYDKQDADGWSIFDPAHLESSALFAGVAAGLDEPTAHFAMLLAWVASSFPGSSGGSAALGWTGSQQPRAVGWMLLFMARASLLGFDGCSPEFRDIFLAGKTPKQHLIGYLHDLIAHPLPLGSEKPDDRTMVDFKDGSNEVAGWLAFQESILFFGLGYVFRSGLVSDPILKQNLVTWIRDRSKNVAARAIDGRGMSYAVSTHGEFEPQCVDAANAEETDPGHLYELVGPAPNFMRDTPRAADCELMLGGLATLLGSANVSGLDALVALPGDPAYADRARYADPYHALLESGR